MRSSRGAGVFHPTRRRPGRLPNPTGDLHARHLDGGGRIRASARRPSAFRNPRHGGGCCRTPGRPGPNETRRALSCRHRLAARPGGRTSARCGHPAPGDEHRLRRHRHARRLGMEGRLRSRRGGAGPVPPALRPPHAPRGGRRTRWSRRHARQRRRRSPPWSRPKPGAPKNRWRCSSSPRRCRWPTRRCRRPRSGRAIPCWNPRPAPGCWP